MFYNQFFYAHSLNVLWILFLLTPGIISGAIVTFKIRYRWTLFVTILSSAIGALLMPISTTLIGKLLATFIPGLWIFDLSSKEMNRMGMGSIFFAIAHYSIPVPVGIVAGATLSGMMLIVQHQLSKSNVKFSPVYWILATIGSAVIGGLICLAFVLISPFLMYLASFCGSIINVLPMSQDHKSILAFICLLITVVIGSTVGGLASAISGIRLAKLFI
jgi:hypothetical protein